MPPTHPDPLTDTLRNTFFFKDWTDEEIANLRPLARLSQREKGDLLFHQEDPCANLYILVEGKVQMFRTSADGREITLHILGPGTLVACAALFLDRSFPASARVISRRAVLVALEGKNFLDLLARRPALARKMIGALALRLSELAHRIESQSADSAHVRLANYLLEQPSRPGPGGKRVVRIEGSKKSLAADLGVTPETFSRCLRKLADGGMIAVDRKEIRLLDPARLLEIVEG